MSNRCHHLCVTRNTNQVTKIIILIIDSFQNSQKRVCRITNSRKARQVDGENAKRRNFHIVFGVFQEKLYILLQLRISIDPSGVKDGDGEF